MNINKNTVILTSGIVRLTVGKQLSSKEGNLNVLQHFKYMYLIHAQEVGSGPGNPPSCWKMLTFCIFSAEATILSFNLFSGSAPFRETPSVYTIESLCILVYNVPSVNEIVNGTLFL